jgi:hypothetical protein
MNVMPRMPLMTGSPAHNPRGPIDTSRGANAVEISLNAAVISIDRDAPCLLMVRHRDATGEHLSLPAGPFVPGNHGSLELGLRDWVLRQTGVDLGYLEQLYTFGDDTIHEPGKDSAPPTVSLGYMALTTPEHCQTSATRQWIGAYDFMPWEDWREGRPEILSEEIEPKLKDWTSGQTATSSVNLPEYTDALRIAFGLDGAQWDEERVLDRYELLSVTGLLDQPGFGADKRIDHKYPVSATTPVSHAHRRILAAALGRLRAKIKYRPVLFELMAPEFTLFELQRTVEAILGSRLHKQNFRRLVESGGLVDATTDIRTHTGGRPAKLFRFRREVLMERPAPGVRVRAGLAA